VIGGLPGTPPGPPPRSAPRQALTLHVGDEQLYASLATTDDLRDAFRAAQVSTRQKFLDPQRWAAFYLLGDWR